MKRAKIRVLLGASSLVCLVGGYASLAQAAPVELGKPRWDETRLIAPSSARPWIAREVGARPDWIDPGSPAPDAEKKARGTPDASKASRASTQPVGASSQRRQQNPAARVRMAQAQTPRASGSRPGQSVPIVIPRPAGAPPLVPAPVPAPPAPGPTPTPALASNPDNSAQTVRATSPLGSGRINVWGREVTIVVPIREGQTNFGNLPMRISVDDVLEIPADQLVSTLGDAITPEIRAGLLAAGQPSGRVKLNELGPLGLEARYDPQSASIFFTRSSVARPTTEISLADFRRDRVENFDAAARTSGYLTTRASVGWQHVGPNQGFDGLDLATSLAFRMGGVVLEADGIGRFSSGDSFGSRSFTRLVYDEPKKDRRWRLGDIDVVAQSYLNSPSLLGLQLSRQRQLFDPRSNLRPTSFEAFQINRESSVDVIVNGQVQRRILLAPGKYTLTDFPFVGGANEVQIVATDRTGQQETTRFNRFFDFSLLGKDEVEYDVSLGILSQPSQAGPQYDSKEFIASAVYRRGINEYLTAGFGFQADRFAQVASIDGVYAQRRGTLAFNGAATNDSRLGFGGASSVSFQRLYPRDSARRLLSAWTVGGELQSENFGAIGQALPIKNPLAARAFVNTSFDFGRDQVASLAVNWEKRRGGLDDTYSIQAAYGFSLGRSVFLNLLSNYRSDNDGGKFGIGLSLSFRLNQSTFVTGTWDSTDSRYDFGLSRLGTRQVGSTTFTGRVGGAPGGISFNGGFSGTSNRAEYALDHSTAYNFDRSEIASSRTSANASASIAVAQGRFAIGRPIADGFAIVAAHKTLKGAPILIDSSEDRYLVRTGALGPALITDVGAYSERTFTVSAPDGPVGYDLGRGSYRLKPPYRAGYFFEAGSDYVVTVAGTLKDERGDPITLTSGSAVYLSEPSGRQVEFFTNSRGQFGIAGLKPGRWRAQTTGEKAVSFEIVIPENTEGLLRIGEVQGQP